MCDDKTDLTKITPPQELDDAAKLTILQHVTRRLASHRNRAELYARTERAFSQNKQSHTIVNKFTCEIDKWARELLHDVWTACQEVGGEQQAFLSSYPSFS